MAQQNTNTTSITKPSALPRLPTPISMSDARKKLEHKSHLICPDTCVLLQMMNYEYDKDKNDKNTNIMNEWLKQLEVMDKWLIQMRACSKLLKNKNVGWVIPEQIRREYEYSKNNPTTKYTPENNELKKVYSNLEKALVRMHKLAIENTQRIIKQAKILEETDTAINSAWKLVHDNEFPNRVGTQQMKDSVILSHLHECADMSSPKVKVYFWTTDSKLSGKSFPAQPAQKHVETRTDISIIQFEISGQSTE